MNVENTTATALTPPTPQPQFPSKHIQARPYLSPPCTASFLARPLPRPLTLSRVTTGRLFPQPPQHQLGRHPRSGLAHRRVAASRNSSTFQPHSRRRANGFLSFTRTRSSTRRPGMKTMFLRRMKRPKVSREVSKTNGTPCRSNIIQNTPRSSVGHRHTPRTRQRVA